MNFYKWIDTIRTTDPRYLAYRKNSVYINNLIAICTNKLEIDHYHCKALFIRAGSYLKVSLYEKAINDCETLLQLDEFNVRALYIKGCAYDKIE